MAHEFIDLTSANIATEHLCCIIRSKKPHPGVEAKRAWLSERIEEGHVFRKLDVKSAVFIEYAPVETAWVPVIGDNFTYIYCLWVSGEYKGKGYGKALMDSCIASAKQSGKSGICMLGSEKQKNWLSNQAFAKKYGFRTVDSTKDGYELLALSFDGAAPKFTEKAKKQRIDSTELTVYYSMQCPFILQKIEDLKQYCETNSIPFPCLRSIRCRKRRSYPAFLITGALSTKDGSKP